MIFINWLQSELIIFKNVLQSHLWRCCKRIFWRRVGRITKNAHWKFELLINIFFCFFKMFFSYLRPWQLSGPEHSVQSIHGVNLALLFLKFFASSMLSKINPSLCYKFFIDEGYMYILCIKIGKIKIFFLLLPQRSTQC